MIISQSAHCALIIMMEAASHHETKGLSLNDVAKSHFVPEDGLNLIAKRLCDSGFLYSKSGNNDENWFFIKGDPLTITVFDVIELFDRNDFSGIFIDTQTGKLLPKSLMGHMINLERNHLIRHVRTRLKKINIYSWSEMSKRNLNLLSME